MGKTFPSPGPGRPVAIGRSTELWQDAIGSPVPRSHRNLMTPSPAPQHNEERRRAVTTRPSKRRPRPRIHGAGLVLIVDDAPDARDIYSLHFRHHGYAALTAPDGDTGIATAIRMRPDVIVMDLAMPGINGISAAHHLKNEPRTRDIPIILLTGHAGKAIQYGALEMGVDVFLTKPCLPEDLETHVQRLIQRRRTTS
jgi:two-component system cell cycle response regulator DivK